MSNHPGEAQRPTDGRNSNGKKVRVGIVGCGEAAQILHWPSLYQVADLYEVTALCDVSPFVLEILGGLWNVDILTADHRELVARSDVDAVLVSNPNAFHSEVTLAALAVAFLRSRSEAQHSGPATARGNEPKFAILPQPSQGRPT